MQSSNLGYTLVQALLVGKQQSEIEISEKRIPRIDLVPQVQTTHLNGEILCLSSRECFLPTFRATSLPKPLTKE